MGSETSLEGLVNETRKQIKDLAKTVKDIFTERDEHGAEAGNEKEDRAEVLANLMLTYRHLEDASMRLGKTLQARDGGVSVYDKETTVGATTGSAPTTDDGETHEI